ncbi:MAG: sugar ABC transporter permease [Turicibacter sp.]|nr:sugar ABC transporter permease [Turicibacter sp.]
MAKAKTRKHSPVFYLFLFPAVFALTLVIIIPFILGVYYSFTDWNAVSGTQVNWVGLQNYTAVFNDVTFLHSFIVTSVFAVINMIVINLVSFGLAMIVTNKLKFTNIYRAGFFLPHLIGGIILGYIWQFIFNNAIPAFGNTIGFSWLAQNPFLAERNLAILAIVIVSTWQFAGYIMMIYVAAIQGVPASLLEAAEIDGATYLQRVRHVLLPLIAPAFTISTFLTLLNSFRIFDVNLALTAGGPAGMFMGRALNTTEFLALNIYNTAFAFRELAQGQAQAVIFFITITTIALIQVYFNKRKEITM